MPRTDIQQCMIKGMTPYRRTIKRAQLRRRVEMSRGKLWVTEVVLLYMMMLVEVMGRELTALGTLLKHRLKCRSTRY